jgi:TonB family protein
MRTIIIILAAIALAACEKPKTTMPGPLATATATTETSGVLPSPPVPDATEATVATPGSCGGEQFLPVSGVDESPIVKASKPPEYPTLKNRINVRGAVVLRVYVRASGEVCAVELVKGVASELDESVLTAVRGWKFKPALAAGKPTGCFFPMTVNVNLNGPN